MGMTIGSGSPCCAPHLRQSRSSSGIKQGQEQSKCTVRLAAADTQAPILWTSGNAIRALGDLSQPLVNVEPEDVSRVLRGGSFRTHDLQLQQLVDERDGVVRCSGLVGALDTQLPQRVERQGRDQGPLVFRTFLRFA